jgi:hypothetical protein
MTKINSKEDWENFYYYKESSKPTVYPSRYPCFADRVTEGGGICGEYEAHYVAYIPNTRSVEKAFLAGLSNPWEYIC